jgi:hypothetical protein
MKRFWSYGIGSRHLDFNASKVWWRARTSVAGRMFTTGERVIIGLIRSVKNHAIADGNLFLNKTVLELIIWIN